MVTHVIGRQQSTDTQTWHHAGTATTSQDNTVSPYKEPLFLPNNMWYTLVWEGSWQVDQFSERNWQSPHDTLAICTCVSCAYLELLSNGSLARLSSFFSCNPPQIRSHLNTCPLTHIHTLTHPLTHAPLTHIHTLHTPSHMPLHPHPHTPHPFTHAPFTYTRHH